MSWWKFNPKSYGYISLVFGRARDTITVLNIPFYEEGEVIRGSNSSKNTSFIKRGEKSPGTKHIPRGQNSQGWNHHPPHPHREFRLWWTYKRNLRKEATTQTSVKRKNGRVLPKDPLWSVMKLTTNPRGKIVTLFFWTNGSL